MENKGLLFIPDISGYTQFVNEMEVGHSRLIIQELLETLINANQIGLELSEIEGDAILFYKFGGTPDLKELYGQVEKMFCEFHKNLIAYDHRKFCQCKACTAAVNMTLKIITHYGEFTGLNVKNFNKLIGKDVIIVHRLLKNDIEQHEYWLVTKSLLLHESSTRRSRGQDGAPPGFTDWMKWDTSSKQTESGEVPFVYTQLGELKNQIKPEPLPLPELSNRVKMLSVSREYETDIITLFHAAGDFNYRSRWQEGVKVVEEVAHFLPRVGMKSRFVLENGEAVVYMTSYSYSPDRIEFSETDAKTRLRRATYFTLEKIGSNKTKLTIDYYLRKNLVAEIMFKLTKKKKMEDMLQKSLQNLVETVKEIKLPAREL